MFNYATVTRPDGAKLYINITQIVYVTKDPADESGNKTEIVTSQGAFIINSPLDKVLSVLVNGGGDL